MTIMLSEIAGEGRWTQFNVPLDWVTEFFRLSELENAELSFANLSTENKLVNLADVHAIYKPNSSNWAFEIPGAAGIEFDAENRPILAISDQQYPTFVFDLILSTESRYSVIADFLNQNRSTPENQLARMLATGENQQTIRNIGVEV